ncbi:hypothetical protein COT42_02365 [Candidatus Saganbacteria bacterium CG08_land_8_20_14_0_20_45_16]|uniref:histidine kinase n=1 Tax=Candidatus Saganbacteria bacterium CG08_land_8_20_14_0_20_45_16 TaxID=2014293 RepID=A0A2H0Y072_UNCSA|nr:MAG: hypothetical protein COT42_02365 [Candidatus Saganbacteria bacterium CG08_land_8_20_14_0_20_45_16]
MLSTLTIISIFTEIFAAGIMLGGGIGFLKQYFVARKNKDAILGFIFVNFFVYVAATIVSQMMFNSGFDLSQRIFVHKGIYLSLAVSAFLFWVFLIERFELKKLRLTNVVVALLSGWFIYCIAQSPVSLIYREGVSESIVSFASYLPLKPFFSLIVFALVVAAFLSALKNKQGQRVLAFYLAASAGLLLLALLFSYYYLCLAQASCLMLSWLCVLLSFVGFLLSELIPPTAPEAEHPLSFFRTRMLFKLILIFVLLVVILFETTTLATINISKQALSKSIFSGYSQMASNLAFNVRKLPAEQLPAGLQQLAQESRVGSGGLAYFVNDKGELIAHPDKKRALQRESMLANEAVRQILAGRAGNGQFKDELGDWVVGAYLPLKGIGGMVVQEPLFSAYAELRRLETNSLLFVIMGIILTSLVGIFFAHSIERPIKELIQGTEALACGNLKARVTVDSLDEMGKLAKAFNSMTKDLCESQERLVLSEKLASLGTMAAGMAHEIKNPLVSVRTFTQVLEQKWEDPEYRKKFSAIVPHEIERINRIAGSLLKFGRPMKPELSRVDLNTLLDEVLLLFESECKKNNVRVTKNLTSLPKVKGDAGQLQQVLVNIVKNAIEAMGQSGGELIVKSDVGQVIRLGRMQREGRKVGEEMVWGEERALDKPIQVVFVEVTDTGEGIAEENLKSLFDPFFTTKMTGTGMGLPITLRIVEEHNGSIKVRSQRGKGTTFIITLPYD